MYPKLVIRSQRQRRKTYWDILSTETIRGLFWRLPKLRTEIRRMIWAFALRDPQVHIMCCKRICVSRVKIIIQAWRKARDEALGLMLPHFVQEL
jgi:hypothetical protein